MKVDESCSSERRTNEEGVEINVNEKMKIRLLNWRVKNKMMIK